MNVNARSLANLKPIQKGETRNPGGRPKIPAEVKELARGLSPRAIEVLGEVMNDKHAAPAARVTAASTILDRAYGKAPQHVTVEETSDLSNAELAGEIASVISGLRALGLDPAALGVEGRAAKAGARGNGSALTH